MKAALDETNRRRVKQQAYNKEHGITPETIRKAIESPLAALLDEDRITVKTEKKAAPIEGLSPDEVPATLKRLRTQMKKAARELEFEHAAELRDQIKSLEAWLLER